MVHSVASTGLMIMPPDTPEPLIQEFHCLEIDRAQLSDPDFTKLNMRVEFGGRSYDFYVIVGTDEYSLVRKLAYRLRPFAFVMLPKGGIKLLSVQLQSSSNDQQIFSIT